jgi:hypothetical protein
MRKNILVTISLSIFILICTYYYFSSNRNAIELTPIQTPKISTQIKPQTKTIPTLKVDEKNIDIHKLSELTKEYLTSKDLKAFIELAKRKPDQGGGYYASHALSKCYNITLLLEGRISYTPKDGGFSQENYGKRQTAFEKVRNLCQNVNSTDLSKKSINEILKLSQNSNDISNQLSNELDKSKSITDPKQHYNAQALFHEKLMHSQDPIMLARYGTKLNTTSSQSSADFWLDGQSYSYTSFDGAKLHKAWDLVPCAFGLDCGLTHPQVAAMCFNHNLCTDSLFHLYHAQYKLSGDNGQNFERMMYFYRRLVEVIRSKDMSPFRPNN